MCKFFIQNTNKKEKVQKKRTFFLRIPKKSFTFAGRLDFTGIWIFEKTSKMAQNKGTFK